MKLRLLAPIAALLLASCDTVADAPPLLGVAGPGLTIETPYHASEFAWSLRPGHSGVRGASPARHSCAGLAVALTPETPYSRERIYKLYGSTHRADLTVAEVRGRIIANDNPDMVRFVRVTRCDSAGDFAFSGLPDGGYFLIAQVAAEGGPRALMRHLSLTAGNVATVRLTTVGEGS